MTADMDVRCLPYMPLQIEQLRKSKTWLRCRRRPELGFYLMNLWMRAWHEVPAGSIEDDDDILADAAMCPPEKWEELRPILLDGWVVEGGRVYHRTVTELATEAVGKLRKNKDRTEAAREAAKRRQSALSAEGEKPVTDAVTAPVTGSEGKGREEEGKEKKESSSPRGKRVAVNDDLAAEFEGTFWPAYPLKKDKPDALKAFRKARAKASLETIMAGLKAFVAEAAGKDRQFIRHAPRWLNAESWNNAADPGVAPDKPTTVEDWRKRLLYGRTEQRWSTARWGPAPGQPGCRAPAELIQETDGQNWAEWEQAA